MIGNFPSGCSVVQRSDIVSGDVHLLDKRSGSGAGCGYNLFIRDGFVSLALQGNNPNVHLESWWQIIRNTKNTVVATVERGRRSVKIYLNGSLVAEDSLVDFDLSNPGDLVIGSRFNDTRFFHGIISEVHIYDYALPGSEIGKQENPQYRF